MSYGLARARYTSDAAQTASPARLLTMLYDRLVVDLATARDAMANGDIEVTGDRLAHASEILLELHATLDTETWPEGESLARLYLWMVGELMQARLARSPQRVGDCLELILPLRDAWQEASRSCTDGIAGAGSPTQRPTGLVGATVPGTAAEAVTVGTRVDGAA